MKRVIQDEFTNLPISRSRKYQLRRLRAGGCTQCGKPRNLSWDKCDECLEKKRTAQRERMNYQPWQPGRRGRPPICQSIKNPVVKSE